MNTKPRPCQAENPGLCPHHGAKAQIDAAATLLAEAAATGDYNVFREAREARKAAEKRLEEAYELQEKLGSKRITQDREDPPTINREGLREWRDSNGLPHRDGDKPARYSGGSKEWYQHGKLHREGGKPAIENRDGSRAWYKNGELHREGAPAIMHPDGGEAWYKNGELHRDGNQPAVIDSQGSEYFKDGKLHRTDGPALVRPGRVTVWYQNDKKFREDGKPHLLRRGLNGNHMAAWFDENGKEERVEPITAQQFKDLGGVL